ncbi:hypothetical protein [Chryseobacterium polytrichastri]|nr:hypothetical protein [Chryseobacterium polytrichastri]
MKNKTITPLFIKSSYAKELIDFILGLLVNSQRQIEKQTSDN